MDISYYKRRLKANKMRRQIMGVRTLLQRVRVLLALIIALLLCAFAVWVLKLPQWYLDSAKLSNADSEIIKIQGNTLTPEEKIRDMVRKTELPYTQIYRLDTKPLEENIKKLQPVKNVYIKRYWLPARIIIAIEERMSVFLLTPNLDTEPNSALTAEGVLINKDYLPFKIPQKAKIILTYGVVNGHEEVWNKKKVDKLIEITKAFEAYSGLEVKYIDLRNEKDSYVMLGEFLIRFGEINETALARIKWIAPIIPEAQKNKNNIKYIDLRWEDSRYFCLKNTKDSKEEAEIKSIKSDKPEENNDKKQEILKPSTEENRPSEEKPAEEKPSEEQQEN